MKKYDVEFAFWDEKTPFNGIYDDPVNDEPIEAETPEEAEEIGWDIAEEEIIRMNQDCTVEEIEALIDQYKNSHIARAIQIEED